MKIKAVVYEAEEGGYWAKVPSLPGVYTQAETLEELEAKPARGDRVVPVRRQR